MATWDQGGGCPCGVSKVCDCRNCTYPYISEGTFKVSKDFDFGFSTHTEQELITVDKTKLIGLKDMIMPLLINLMKNPHNEIIKWPNRKDKIEEFIKKIDDYIAKE